MSVWLVTLNNAIVLRCGVTGSSPVSAIHSVPFLSIAMSCGSIAVPFGYDWASVRWHWLFRYATRRPQFGFCPSITTYPDDVATRPVTFTAAALVIVHTVAGATGAATGVASALALGEPAGVGEVGAAKAGTPVSPTTAATATAATAMRTDCIGLVSQRRTNNRVSEDRRHSPLSVKDPLASSYGYNCPARDSGTRTHSSVPASRCSALNTSPRRCAAETRSP